MTTNSTTSASASLIQVTPTPSANVWWTEDNRGPTSRQGARVIEGGWLGTRPGGPHSLSRVQNLFVAAPEPVYKMLRV
jgi:hypothetical protein